MSCMEFMTLINDYIYNRIDNEKVLEDFIEHQHNCPNCREELELYYTLQRGLEDEEIMLDFSADLDKKLQMQKKRIIVNRRVRKFMLIVSTLGMTGLFLALLIIILKIFI